MATRIRIYGDPVLRQQAAPVQTFDAELRAFADEMIESMLAADSGVGLAAPQIGVSKRIVVIDRSFGERSDDFLVIVNPEIVEAHGSILMEEGCLSVPGIYEDVERPEWIRVRYADLDGEAHELETDGFLARVIQHETDHLNGVLFIDRLGTVTRDLLSKTLRSMAAEQQEQQEQQA